jgi:hypothetical protein
MYGYGILCTRRWLTSLSSQHFGPKPGDVRRAISLVKASRVLRSRVRPNLGPFPSKALLLNRSFGEDGVASYSVTSIPQNVSMTSACQTMLWSPTSSHCPSGYIRTAQKFRLRPYFAARATARLKRRYATDAEVDSKDPSGKDKSLSSMTVDFEHSGHC